MMTLILKVKEQGTTILMIEHIMPVIMQLSDMVYVMERGAVISQGKPYEVANDPKVIESYLGKSLEVDHA